MKKYRIITPYGTQYEIDEDGCFIRYNEHKWNHPHDSWKCTGCAELIAFGNVRYYSFNKFIEMIEHGQKFTFKNGNPKYTLTDLDCGTHRLHSNTKYHGIKYAYEMK